MSAVRVRDLLERLDAEFPMVWAEPWDRVGLLVGDPEALVERVFVSLDPTPPALAAAIEGGAQVLLTHHPAFLEAPERFAPAPGTAGVPFAAACARVALVACHTNLDRAPAGADALPTALGLRVSGPLESSSGVDGAIEALRLGDACEEPGVLRAEAMLSEGAARMGRVCEAPEASSVGSLAAHVSRVLGVRVRVWGDGSTPVSLVGVAPGSGRSLVEDARRAGCEALITGELRYHEALEAADRGLAVIEAGHDATEWPLVPVLASGATRTEGLDERAVLLDRTSIRWWTTEGV